MRLVSVFAVVGPLLLLQGCDDDSGIRTGSAADLIVIGDVHTMDASTAKAAAIAVAGGRLAFVGDARRARTLLRPGGRTIELAPGQIVLPRLVASHVHMLEAGGVQLRCPLKDPQSTAGAAGAARARRP